MMMMMMMKKKMIPISSPPPPSPDEEEGSENRCREFLWNSGIVKGRGRKGLLRESAPPRVGLVPHANYMMMILLPFVVINVINSTTKNAWGRRELPPHDGVVLIVYVFSSLTPSSSWY